MQSLEDSHFASAKNLVILGLNYNKELSFISDNAFASQQYTLQRLYLDNCALSTTNGKALGSLQHPNVYVTLSDNPWNCNCELQVKAYGLYMLPAIIGVWVCVRITNEVGWV